MEDQKQKVIDSLKQANNILVTVRNSPSIDQLAACIALTLIVNELGKHGTAVFSGHVPSTLEFLEPDKTLERNTDSLRDFIISLDKAKADKLRYKVEDTVVKVFITPYRTSLSVDDLEFGQGDFNVDVVVALGVHNQNDLDEAITAHGRILHDATVISLNTEGGGAENLGSINWIDNGFSSLSEMVFSFVDKLGKEAVVDNQVATALLTGIVAETGRFSNAKTKPQTLETAAKLLAAGANQELVAAKLSEPERPEEPTQEDDPATDGGVPPESPTDGGRDGELDIEHSPNEWQEPEPPQSPEPSPQPQPAEGNPELAQEFAQENAAFDIPQEQPQSDQKDQPPDEPKPDVPPIIDLNQPSPPKGEEQEALDYLKEHKIDTSAHARLEPLHKPGEILEMPAIVPDQTRDEAQAPGSNDDALGERFALTPPSMGGTLTANLPQNDDYDTLLEDQKPTGPMLSHDSRSVKPAESEAKEAPKLEAAPTTQPPLDAAPLQQPQPQQEPESQPAKTEPGPAPAIEAVPHGEKPHYTTLEELEKQVHAHESEPSGAKDMPAPKSVTLPSPQTTSPTASPVASPLAPPPPVPPPLPHA